MADFYRNYMTRVNREDCSMSFCNSEMRCIVDGKYFCDPCAYFHINETDKSIKAWDKLYSKIRN